MNHQLNLIFLLAALLGLSACASKPTLTHAPPKEIAEAKAKGEKLYIVYDPKAVYAPPGVRTMSVTALSVMARTMGAELVRPVPYSSAFVVKSKRKPKVPKGLKVQEENIFHTYETLYRITPVNTEAPQCPKCPACPTDPGEPAPTNPSPITNITWGQKMVRAAEASSLTSAQNIKVCDIDTGLDKSVHSQFPPGTIKQGVSMVPNEPWDVDPGKHGTHTAGTIASTKYGVARVSLYVVKSLANSGSGSSSWLASGINQCRAWGAQVISASWGMDRGTDSLIASAVAGFVASGGVFVAAAGNSSGGPIGFPANMPQVMAVTSMDEAGRLSSFSSRGAKTGEMYIAPGSNVLSLCPNGTCTMSGTSMATPHVAAIVAIALSKGKKQIGFINRNLPATDQGRGQADAYLSAGGM